MKPFKFFQKDTQATESFNADTPEGYYGRRRLYHTQRDLYERLRENEDEIVPHNGASWMWCRLENLDQYNYDIVLDYYYGIHSFLNQFPAWYIASVLTITGPNGFVHNIDNDGVGWGFDILSDEIRIQWIRFRE